VEKNYLENYSHFKKLFKMEKIFRFNWSVILFYFISMLSIISTLGCSEKELRCKCCNPSLYQADSANCKKISWL